MLLFRTICRTDHKSRPNHDLVLVGEGSQEELVQMMDRDVCLWQADEVVDEHEDTVDEDSREARITKLAGDPDLVALWKHEDRFEMRACPASIPRVFVERRDDERCTTVYHFVELPPAS